MIRLAFGKGKYGTRLDHWEGELQRLYDSITNIDDGMCKDKFKQAYLLTTADFEPMKRNGDNIKDNAKYSVIIIDGDEGIDGNPIAKGKGVHIFLKDMGINHIIVSSYSTSKEKDKWRAIIPAEGVTRGTVESTTRSIVGKIQNAGYSIAYAKENHATAQPWFFGGMKDKSLQEKYIYDGGKSLQSVKEMVKTKDSKGKEANTDSQTMLEIIQILKTGNTGYHPAQRDYSWGKIKDRKDKEEVKEKLHKYAIMWKEDTKRWNRCYKEIDEIVEGAVKKNIKEAPYIKYNLTVQIDEAWKVREEREKNGYGLQTHMKSLNKLIRGFSKKQTITIGAATGKGKTALALNFASHIADTSRVLYLSLEMTEEQVFERLANQEHGDMDNIPRGAYDLVGKKNLIVQDTKCNKIDLIEELGLRMKQNEGIECIFVDHIHKIRKHKNNTLDSLQDITERLSSLAKELDLPLIMLSQMNRNLKNEKGIDKKPELSNLRGSGSIEEDSNIVLLINRPILMKPEIIVAKNRNGMIGTVTCKFNGSRIRFTDATPMTKKELEEQIKAREPVNPVSKAGIPNIFTA